MLKYSVAIAALLVGAPMAFAQGAGDMGKNGGGAGMSNSGPSSSGPGSSGLKSGGASHERSGASSGASEGASGSSASDFAPGHQKGSGSASENSPGHMKSDGSAKDYSPGHRKDSSDKSERRSESKADHNAKNSDRADRGERKSDRNARSDRDRDHSNRNAKNDNDRNKNEARTNDRGGASTGASEGTEGRSDSKRGSITSVTTEQRTKVGSVFTRHRVEPVRNLNIAVNVGVRIPHSVHLYPVPVDVIEIVPAYRDYEYIVLDDNRIAIIDPDTYEVVDIIVLA